MTGPTVGDVSFLVDLDQVDEVAAEMARCQRRLEQLGSDLERRMRALHGEWVGLAADAHALAHAAWNHGLQETNAALVAIHGVATTAHDNYRRAAETNLAMWRATG